MKVLYLSSIWFSDIDLSMLSELQKKVDVDYIISIDQSTPRGCAVDIKSFYPHSGMYSPSIYPELNKFSKIIDTKKMYVQNIYHGRRVLKFGPSLGLLWANISLLWFVLKNRYDVIHTPVGLSYLRYWMFLMKKKVVIAIHDPIPHTGDFISSGMKKSYKKFIHFQIFNTTQKRAFVELYNLENKYVYVSRLSVYNYLKIFDINKTSISDDYILFFGRISPYKGLDYLLPAMKIVHDTIPNLKLVVAGSGHFNFDISEYGSLSFIEIRNRYIEDHELASLISNSKFVVCPYIDATQSGVLMSCFAFNKPVIVTKVGGLPEMVGNGEYGIIVKEKDEKALADAIIQLCKDQHSLDTFEQKISKEYQKGRMSWAVITDEYVDMYKRVVLK